jgi:citrate lyase subunit beta/citryl-CoA lyase
MLAKTEDPQQVRDLAPLDVVVLIETPLGAVAVSELARMDNALALMWGAEDLFAVLRRHRQPVARRQLSRGRAGTCGRKPCWRPRHTDGWRWTRCTSTSKTSTACGQEVDDAVAVGFDAKVAIHPSQVAVIRAGYAPTDEQVDWARRCSTRPR